MKTRNTNNFAPQRAPFFARPHWTLRQFFQFAGSALSASYLTRKYARPTDVHAAGVTTINKAKNVIFILLQGAPSHVDTFDLKVLNGTTPISFAPSTINGMLFPTGLMPKLAAQLPNIAIVRSMQAHALVHTLGQTWVQIGRNPAAALGSIAPNIGSIVAIEKDSERRPGQVFPTFLALNSPGAVTQGYLSAQYAPFKVIPSTAGITNTTNPDGQTVFTTRWNAMHQIDDPLRVNSPYGQPLTDYDNFYTAAKGLMYNDVVNNAFKYTASESARYGSSTFGNSCLLAKQVLAANQGTRYIEITFGSWDMHIGIYNSNQLPSFTKQLDNGLSALIGDLQANGLLNETLIVMHGEFGRTVGPLTGAQGRDHYPQQFAVFAGAGVKGGAIGTTNADGSDVEDYGWSQQRYVYPEDIEATIYSAMGIDWTTVRTDDPFHRGFAYVPDTDPVTYYPINELWGSPSGS